MFLCNPSIVSPHNMLTLTAHCFRGSFVTQSSQDGVQYEWVRSLAVSLSIVSCFAGDDNDSHCPPSETHRWHSLHSTWSICTQHSWPRYASTAPILNSWIILLSLVQEGECVWFWTRGKGEGEPVILFFFSSFFVEKKKRERRELLGEWERSVRLMSGSWRIGTAGLC